MGSIHDCRKPEMAIKKIPSLVKPGPSAETSSILAELSIAGSKRVHADSSCMKGRFQGMNSMIPVEWRPIFD